MLITNVVLFSDCCRSRPGQTCFKMRRGGCVAALLKLESRFERLCRSNSTTKSHRLWETHSHTHTFSISLFLSSAKHTFNLSCHLSRNAHFPRSLCKSRATGRLSTDESENPVKALTGHCTKEPSFLTAGELNAMPACTNSLVWMKLNGGKKV